MVAVWGTNFVVIRVGLDHLPPLLFATLRFALAALPGARAGPAAGRRLGEPRGLRRPDRGRAVRPPVHRHDGHISPGLASLVVQMQVFFTIGLSVWWLGERVRAYQLAALAVAARASP